MTTKDIYISEAEARHHMRYIGTRTGSVPTPEEVEAWGWEPPGYAAAVHRSGAIARGEEVAS